ncbi:hypothetical protein Mgra_00003698 [Meloidogyne graminicola]|uniref:Uncharacterized protein n=1 Tax=Meloidogyne graminicola TaxID=189291 RepID=A0A8S9ZUF6_9BILA|nr:hypothetical protein Mgra_00003698 [Meloidogyne graminicola]
MAPTIDFGPVQYGCTKYKRRMVIYESILLPGKRFNFCYSSSYKDKHGIETAYYKCVGCMHSKRSSRPFNLPIFHILSTYRFCCFLNEDKEKEKFLIRVDNNLVLLPLLILLPSFQINNIQQQQQQRSLNLEQQNKLKLRQQ